jgi:hypothetical protein
VLRVAERRARVATRGRQPRGLADALPGRHKVDLRSRHHHLPRPPLAEGEHVLGVLLLPRLDQTLLEALAKQQPKLFGRVPCVSDLTRARDPERRQDGVSHPVEEVDERPRREGEGTHRHGDRQRSAYISCYRKALRRELAQYDVEQCYDAEGEGVRNHVRVDARGVQELLEGGLADEAEPDRRDRDPDLARGEVGVEM